MGIFQNIARFFLDRLTPEQAVGVMRSVGAARGAEFQQSVAVHLANDLGMNQYGISMDATIQDTSRPITYSHLEAAPYSRPAEVVMNLVTCEVGGEQYALLGNLEGDYYRGYAVPPGGYMNPHPAGRETLNQPGFDDDLNQAARRKLAEETGINPAIEPRHVGEPVSLYGVSDNPQVHTVQHYLLWELGEQEKLPPLPSGSHFQNASWIKVKDIDVQKGQLPKGVATCAVGEIADTHAFKLNEALTMVRDRKLDELGAPLPTLRRYAQAAADIGVKDYQQAIENLWPVSLGKDGQAQDEALLQMAQHVGRGVAAATVIDYQQRQSSAGQSRAGRG